MSEEEIIKQLKDSCILDNNCYEVDCLFEKDLEAIRSLLDLYQKAKEKNKKLDKIKEMLYSSYPDVVIVKIAELLEEEM